MRPPPLSVLLTLAAACGPPAADAVPPAPPALEMSARPRRPTRADELVAAQVYDAAGNASACAPPLPSCPNVEPDRAFLDRCRAAGFQVRQCGCEQRCGGDVHAEARRYDEKGNAVECAPAKADCTPPQVSASFQDACTERGHKLTVCGCAWLCSGNPKK